MWSVNGLLAAKGVTRAINLAVSVQELSDESARIRLTGQLDRRSYGIRAPRFMIGSLVDIEIEAAFGR